MDTTAETRRKRLQLLRDKHGSLAALNRVLGRDPRDSTFSQILARSPDSKTGKAKTMGTAMARGIESGLNDPSIPEGWMDRPIDEMAAGDLPLPVGFERVPVVGTAQLGDDGFWYEFEYPTGYGDGFVLYPMKDRNGYALRVKGDSMRPRLKHGEFVIVSPNTTATPGDEVAVKIADGRVMVKVFDWLRDGVYQFSSVNEDHKRMTFASSEITFVHVVVGTMKSGSYYPDNA